jgi:putative peptidoglycan lipid II flippase
MFVLVGQVLNARGSFGPMMWAPIANNVVAVSVLVIYLVSFGPAKDLLGGYTPRQELLLGAGSTLGIITQFLILVPFVRATGYRFRPAWDFRGSGLGHTLRLGMWTVGFVMVNQVAYFAIVRIASRGATAAAAQGEVIAAYTVYANASALVLVPHAIATVSLGTAMLPRISSLASQGDLAGARQEIARVLRIALSLVVPVVLLLPVISPAVADIVWGYAAASGYSSAYASTMVSFAPALLFFTVHYLMLRGFYALERNRTVFWVQCVIAVVNVVLAVALTTRASDGGVADALSLAYGGAYLIGSVTSYLLLRRTLSGLETRRLASFAVRIIALGAVAAVAAWGVSELFLALVPWTDKLATLARLMLVGGTDIALLLIGARLVGPSEIVDMEHLVRTRVRRGRHG